MNEGFISPINENLYSTHLLLWMREYCGYWSSTLTNKERDEFEKSISYLTEQYRKIHEIIDIAFRIYPPSSSSMSSNMSSNMSSSSSSLI